MKTKFTIITTTKNYINNLIKLRRENFKTKNSIRGGKVTITDPKSLQKLREREKNKNNSNR